MSLEILSINNYRVCSYYMDYCFFSLSLSMHWATDKIYYIFSKKRFSDTPVKWNFLSLRLTLKRLEVGGGERGQPEPPCDFSKRVFSRENVKPCFYLGFIIIISHVQKIGRFSTSILTIFTNFSDSLTFNCCKETNDIGI